MYSRSLEVRLQLLGAIEMETRFYADLKTPFECGGHLPWATSSGTDLRWCSSMLLSDTKYWGNHGVAESPLES